MNGIEILNKTEILVESSYAGTLMLVAIFGLMVGVICLSVIPPKIKNAIFQLIVITIFVIITVASMVSLVLSTDLKSPTGEYEYQVTIDDSVSFTEFNEKYEVISQEGKIFTVKERK